MPGGPVAWFANEFQENAMSLSESTKHRLNVAVTSTAAGAELAAAIDATGSGPAAVVTAIGASTNIPAAACAGAATPTATQVNAAVDTCNAVIETRLDAIESKVNSLIAALKGAGIMASS